MEKIVHYSNLFKDFFNVAIGSVLVILVKKIINRLKARKEVNKLFMNDTKERFNTLENALIALQHDRLYRLTEEYIARGYVTLDELDNLEYIYKSYTALGGNGSGTRRYNLVQKLPIINEGENDND